MENVFATPDGVQPENSPGGSPAPEGYMSVVRLIDSLRFARSRKAPHSHRASATCAPRLAAPDRSGVPPLCAFGLLCRCCSSCRSRSSCIWTTLRRAKEPAHSNGVCANARSRTRRCRRCCRTAPSGPRSAGPHSHAAAMLYIYIYMNMCTRE
jgi:hypothetical protein